MACISADGVLSTSGRRMLQALATQATLQDVADQAGLALFRVRSGLRDLADAGLVVEEDGAYRLTEAGASRLADGS